MIRKTVEFSTPGTRLSVLHRQLVIERPSLPKATLPIEDLGIVIVDDLRATYTQAVFLELLQAGATVMVTGHNHLPVGMMLPLDSHHVQTKRHRAQAEASLPTKKQIWQTIVSSKIKMQGRVLQHFNGDHAGLIPMAGQVRSGDPNNMEAQAAQRYWPRIFGKKFRRDRKKDGVNAFLNYGYAVLRAACARAITAAGLIPSLGVFHKNRSNPFCLADDLFEPWRPIVDWRVKNIFDAAGNEPNLDNREVRGEILSLLNETIPMTSRRLPLLMGIHASANSLTRYLTSNEKSLILPEGLPLDQKTLSETEN